MSVESLTVVQALRKTLALFERIEARAIEALPEAETMEELEWARDFCRDLAADIDLLVDPRMSAEDCRTELARRSELDRERHELYAVIYAKTGTMVDSRSTLEELRELRDRLRQREDEYVRTVFARGSRHEEH
jgi:hypothetical protein